MIVIETLLIIGVVAVLGMAVYAGYKMSRYVVKEDE
jgi:hypothetical protein